MNGGIAVVSAINDLLWNSQIFRVIGLIADIPSKKMSVLDAIATQDSGVIDTPCKMLSILVYFIMFKIFEKYRDRPR